MFLWQFSLNQLLRKTPVLIASVFFLLLSTSPVLRGLVLPSRQTASRDKAQRSKCRAGAPVKNKDVDELSNNCKFLFKLRYNWHNFIWWLRWLRICLQCGRLRFYTWVRKSPWRRKWLPTPVFLPGKCHGQRSLAGYTMGSQKVGHDWESNT